ncbi:MAG TPA: polysaccharide biosynthesis/export family protein [Longimicrobiales bacterium]
MPRSLCRSLVFTISFLGAVAAPVAGQVPAPVDSLADIVLHPGDAVRIEIRDEPQISGEFPVGRDGALMLPLLGLVPVAGRPFDQVRQDLSMAYRRELIDPELRITPLVRIAVLGEVRRPGLFMVDPTQTMGELIALAGGFTPVADRDDITVLRGEGEVAAEFELGSETMYTMPQSGDRILVPRQSWFRDYLGVFLGAVGSVAVAVVTGVLVR